VLSAYFCRRQSCLALVQDGDDLDDLTLRCIVYLFITRFVSLLLLPSQNLVNPAKDSDG
jgi:hypothetical protein